MKNSSPDKFLNIEKLKQRNVERGITPTMARRDYYNQILGVRMCLDPVYDSKTGISSPISNELFWKRLREWIDEGKGFLMRKLSDKYPPDEYPGIIDNLPLGTVARFDAIAQEINDLYSSGKLTQEKIREVDTEMKKLCYE